MKVRLDVQSRLSEKISAIEDKDISHVVLSSNFKTKSHSEPIHSHKKCQISFVLQGIARFSMRDTHYIVSPNKGIWIPAEIPHVSSFSGQVQIRNIYLNNEVVNHFPTDCRSIAMSPLLREMVDHLCNLNLKQQHLDKNLQLFQVALKFIEFREYPTFQLKMPDDERLEKLVKILLSNPSCADTLKQLSKTVGVSERNANRLFQKQTGMNFITWRSHLRILRALELLSQGESVTNTALEVGFTSTSSFSKFFNKFIGDSPQRYQMLNFLEKKDGAYAPSF